YPLVILHTADVSESALARLRDAASDLVQCEPIIVNDPRLALLARPELNISFTKLWAWTLTHYAKIVFLDADVLVVANIDDLMARTAEFVAAPDSGWPDIFNSGVFVATPARATFDALCSRLAEFGSFDGGDQGLLNAHFGDAWRGDLAYRLPFTDNTTPSGAY
ncbi:nucleotide-diphospho-sugar transferase, partial [Blastocladiella britannica]